MRPPKALGTVVSEWAGTVSSPRAGQWWIMNRRFAQQPIVSVYG